MLLDLDHTADIQLHAWGDTLKEAFAHVIPCMFNYMTDLSTVVEEEGQTVMVQAHGTVVIYMSLHPLCLSHAILYMIYAYNSLDIVTLYWYKILTYRLLRLPVLLFEYVTNVTTTCTGPVLVSAVYWLWCLLFPLYFCCTSFVVY